MRTVSDTPDVFSSFWAAAKRSSSRSIRRLVIRQSPLYIRSADLVYTKSLVVQAGNIQERRNKAGLTQRDLAVLAGVDRAFLNQIEQGMRNPTVVVLAKLARALDITVSTLTRGI
ncbi:helix-turn-helix domain-containing protein [Mycobacterium persicum]|uniref:helix-turn-helix domain-containing protein n=1 Tax=Mycobacterium persicum TaxID=1487726 RepID=UPI000F033938|nr:helix-turn-helix transcriptional regulator [Mycobacterium persicum]